MKVLLDPEESDWPRLLLRPALDIAVLDDEVRQILENVRYRGDEAVREYSRRFDNMVREDFRVSEDELAAAKDLLPKELVQAILVASDNIRRFHAARQIPDVRLDTMPGVTCWTKTVPVQRVGIYIPGGSAPLFSTVLMLGIPAALAGCPEVVLCTPGSPNGSLNPAILFAARVCGIKNVFRIGGAQAVAAMAYGTASVPAVDKIFGPGNQYVTKAKQLVSQQGVGIDFPAGPSEVLIVADATADPGFIAADLLSQAEHGADSQVVLVALDEEIIPKVREELVKQLETLPRKSFATKALQNGFIIYFPDRSQAMRFSNAYAPEHLIINTTDSDQLAKLVSNAGSVFLGPYSPEAAGDYASGTNHTLPTGGYARIYGGISCASFTKEITFQQLTREGLGRLGPSVEVMAAAEGLEGHKKAISVRLL